MVNGTLYAKAPSKMFWGMCHGFANVGTPWYGFVMGGGAESGGNLKTDHDGKSGV
jgi:hypothetical protein